MLNLLLLSTFVASAFASSEGSLSKLLQSKLELSTLVSCGNECPITDPSIQSLVAKSIDGCCPRDYLSPCTGLGLQRTIATWTIKPGQGNDQKICPITPGESSGCLCQEFLDVKPNNTFSICPNSKPCCPNCECHGDPHCKAFDEGIDDWVVCDNRNADCQFPKTNDGTCAKSTYGGKPCAFINGFCQWDSTNPALTQPKMDMYDKTFTYQGNNNAKFQVTLFLGVYGSISSIQVVDPTSATPYTFAFSFGGTTQCVVPNNFPAGVLTKVIIDNKKEEYTMNGLGGGSVYMTFLCIKGSSSTNSRWEVPTLRDASFAAGLPGFGGYCATGNIAEQSKTDVGAKLCTNYDIVVLKSTLFNRVGYNINCKVTALSSCKLNWCGLPLIENPKGSQKNWMALGFASQQACAAYTEQGGDGKNFLRALCAVSYKVHLADPTKCDTDADCKACLDDVVDFPDEILDNLLPGGGQPGSSPSGSSNVVCPSDAVFTAAGIARPTIPSPFAGIQVEFQAATNGPWTPIFSKTTNELGVWNTCKGHYCGTPFGNNVVFQKAGNYRMLQIYPGTTPDQCIGADGWTLSVQYPGTLTSESISLPYGTAVEKGLLVCADGDGTKCPQDYTCCVWPDAVGFDRCMTSYTNNPNWSKVFPNCKPPVVA